MSYYENIAEIAKEIRQAAAEIGQLERKRLEWIKPEQAMFTLGHHLYVTRKDGTTPELLEGVKREVLKAFDAEIFAQKNKVEGLRFKLVNLAKDGGAA